MSGAPLTNKRLGRELKVDVCGPLFENPEEDVALFAKLEEGLLAA